MQSRLVKAMWGVTAFRRRENRDSYLSMLEDRHGYRLNPPRDNRDFDDASQLVHACLDHSGALQALVDIIEEFVGKSVPVQNLRTLVNEVDHEPLLQAGERERIHRLVQGIDEGGTGVARPLGAQALYREVVGPSYPLVEIGSGGIHEIIAKLEELTVGVDSVPPLLDFVEALAARTDGQTAAALQEWNDGFARRLNVEPQLQQIRRHATYLRQGAPVRTYLIIELRPDGVTPDRYLVAAWLQADGEHGVMLRCEDDEPMPLDRLPGVIAELLTEDEHVVNRPTPELTLEFVLPTNLLGEPLDQLRITVDGLERRLGIDHPVVVRSLDRMRRQAHHHAWRRKWGWLRKNPSRARVCWVTQSGQYPGENLYNMLLSEMSSVCMAMAFPPRADGAGPPDELRIALQAGSPIVAWCREGRAPDRFADEFQALVDRGALDLPESVLKLRREALLAMDADGAPDHLGLDLTLLFDDADRLPQPYLRLNAPA